MNITINEREKNKLQDAVEILERYSAMYSALVKGKSGMFYDDAASAAGMLKTIIKESYKDTENI
jgi:hypothetical protein